MDIQVGSFSEGKVTKITSFGAFVALKGGGSGLVHISEIANTFVRDVHDFLQEGQTVQVKILSAEAGKINLSIKQAPQGAGQAVAPAAPVRQAPPVRRAAPRSESTLPLSGDQAFEDKLKQFLSSSEGKMADLNRNLAGKQGSRRRK